MNARPLAEEQLLGNGGLVWAKFEQAAGHRALAGLALILEAEVFSADRLGEATVDLRVALSVNQSQSGWFRLGTALARTPLHLPPTGSEHRQRRVTLELIVAPEALTALEVQRNGGDLRLHLEWAATAVTSTGIGLAGSHSEYWDIAGEQWVTRVLAQAQTHRAVTIMATAPDADASDGYRLADHELVAATQALRTGRYGEAVMAVRRGVDLLGARSLQAPNATARNDRTVDERYGALAEALHHLVSVAAHPEGRNVDYRWSREDALTAVGVLTALMARVPGVAAAAPDGV